MQGSHAMIVLPYLLGGVAVTAVGALLPGRVGLWIYRLGSWTLMLAGAVGVAVLGISAYAYWIDVHPDSAYTAGGFIVTLAIALGGIWAKHEEVVVDDDEGGSHLFSTMPLPRPNVPPLAPAPLPPGSDWDTFEALRGGWSQPADDRPDGEPGRAPQVV